MKNYLKIILVIMIILCSVSAGYVAADKTSKSNDYAKNSITTTKMAVTEKNMDERVALFQSKQDDYYIYSQGTKVILVHGGKEFEFDNWSKYITLEKPTVYATDLDRNGDLELAIRIVGNVDSNGKYYHYVYALNERKNEKGELDYFVTAFTQGSVFSLIDDKVTSEVSQLPTSKGTGVFAMCMNYTTIKYDKKSGIPDDKSYYCLFRTLKDENGQYLDISHWKKDLADFEVEDKAILVTMPITMTYSNGAKQNAGYARCKFDLYPEGSANVLGGSFIFVPNQEYRVFGLNYSSDKKWNKKIVNTTNAVPDDKIIDSFNIKCNFTDSKAQKLDFATLGGDLNGISKIYATESYVEFTAKAGCRFNQEIADKNRFSLMMKAVDKGSWISLDIGNLATISTDKAGIEVLRISFDKSYKQEVTGDIDITFGAE